MDAKRRLVLVIIVAAFAGPAVGLLLHSADLGFLAGGVGLLTSCLIAIVGAFAVSDRGRK